MTPAQRLTQTSEVTRILQSQIPLTKAMGLQVTAWDGQTVTLVAPLEPNLNHADTAFGGSIASIAALAGYTLLFLVFRDRGISTRILIQKSVIEYRLPIDAEFSASATCPGPEALEEFLEALKRKRRARMEITTPVFSRGSIAATHTGLYIAMVY